MVRSSRRRDDKERDKLSHKSDIVINCMNSKIIRLLPQFLDTLKGFCIFNHGNDISGFHKH